MGSWQGATQQGPGNAGLGCSPDSGISQAPGTSLLCPFWLPFTLALFCSCIESDCGLPVPWSSYCGGGVSERHFPVFEGLGRPFQTLELSHTSFFSCHSLQSLDLGWS